MTRSLKLTVAYDGTRFFGWQWQPEFRTVQGELERAIHSVTGESLRVVASGRTDTGVHALGQAVSMETDSTLPCDVLQRAFNANTPEDLTVMDVVEVESGFNAIDDSTSKRYRYLIHDGPTRDVFSRSLAWHVKQQLDVDSMAAAAELLLGEHDFKSFESSGSPRVSTVRTILDFTVERRRWDHDERVVIEVEANGFLYNMVRNLVGTLYEVGRGKRPVDWTEQVLEARDRTQAGMTAPPQGLYLVLVRFGER